jgi:16S rRNA (guanine966-N2)-methyltransferase
VERNFKAMQVIKSNVKLTKDNKRFKLLKKDANLALDLANLGLRFDLVFLDPP